MFKWVKKIFKIMKINFDISNKFIIFKKLLNNDAMNRLITNILSTAILIGSFLAVISYEGSNELVMLLLALQNSAISIIWLHISPWGKSVKKYIISFLNANS